jgi:hypothetical protein
LLPPTVLPIVKSSRAYLYITAPDQLVLEILINKGLMRIFYRVLDAAAGSSLPSPSSTSTAESPIKL